MLYSYEKFLVELGLRLRTLRQERGWTLREMIISHGFHLAQWQSFEKGKGISVPSLLRMCEVFDLTLEALIAELGRKQELPAGSETIPDISDKKSKSPRGRSATKTPSSPPARPQPRPGHKPKLL